MENENTTALSTVLTRQHNEIGESFVNRVKEMLSSGELVITTYGVDSAFYHDVERIKFQVNSKVTLELNLTRTK
jgi:hypothetical protein